MRLLSTASALLLTALLAGCGVHPQITVTNNDATRHRFSASLGGSTVGPTELQPGETQILPYRVQRDSGIIVQVDGEQQLLDGYIGGTDNDVVIVIQDGRAALQ